MQWFSCRYGVWHYRGGKASGTSRSNDWIHSIFQSSRPAKVTNHRTNTKAACLWLRNIAALCFPPGRNYCPGCSTVNIWFSQGAAQLIFQHFLIMSSQVECQISYNIAILEFQILSWFLHIKIIIFFHHEFPKTWCNIQIFFILLAQSDWDWLNTHSTNRLDIPFRLTISLRLCSCVWFFDIC